jgi:thiol-disulfide isomerase/thioredoxin
LLAGLTVGLAAGCGEAQPLKDQPAPALKLPLLGGGELSTADLKDKNVVILDFWATWCPPCRRALPVLAEVAQAFKDRGVAFYAVNLREDEKTIRDYLEKAKLQVTVALDKDGKAAGLYQVEGIPQSVIIGKDGLVKQVHVGFLPNLKETLTKELEEALGPAAPAAKPAEAAKGPAAGTP